MEHTIDAKRKPIGRVATEAAAILLGKNDVTFAKNTVADVKVNIINASQSAVLPSKRGAKTYKRYSGYPGGLKEISMDKVIDKKGYAEIYRLTIMGMLPKNKLRARIIKNLNVTE